MALISLKQAAIRSGVPRIVLEEWVKAGLLIVLEDGVEEEDLDRTVESMGWLKVSSERWDGPDEN